LGALFLHICPNVHHALLLEFGYQLHHELVDVLQEDHGLGYTSKAVIIQPIPVAAFGIITIVGFELCGALALIHGMQELEQNIFVSSTKELCVRPVLSSDSLLTGSQHNNNLFFIRAHALVTLHLVTVESLIKQLMLLHPRNCEEISHAKNEL
jgi:hypothetical protein